MRGDIGARIAQCIEKPIGSDLLWDARQKRKSRVELIQTALVLKENLGNVQGF